MKQAARTPQERKPAAKNKRKSRDELNQEARSRKRDKKHRGNVSGSRANPVTEKQQNSSGSKDKDPRIGSKTPIALNGEGETAKPIKPVKTSRPQKEKKVPLTPKEELATLENDERLDKLLDRLEDGGSLSAEEQSWLDQTLDRIDVLMEELGIAIDDDVEDEAAEEDMYRLLKGKN